MARAKDAAISEWCKKVSDQTATRWHYLRVNQAEFGDGNFVRVYRISNRFSTFGAVPEGEFEPSQVVTSDQLTSQGEIHGSPQEFEFRGRTWVPPKGLHWKTTVDGLKRLAETGRVIVEGNSIRYLRLLEDYPVFALSNVWEDIGGIQSRTEGKLYAVQTATLAIERCILMTTDPGDLVFDPTCGSGTTAYCAEKWGRRWITCDTSRVALAIARQRLMTAKFDYYELRDPERGPAGGFIYETVPHITLESIAKNTEIDAIVAKYQLQIDAALTGINQLVGVGRGEVTSPLQEWEIPREFSDGWPEAASKPFQRFWSLKRQKRQEIDESIQRHAPQETLYDRPQVKRRVVRVSGPFTVEAIPVPAIEDPTQAPILQFEETLTLSLPRIAGEGGGGGRVSDRGGDYLTTMLNLLKQQGGVLFPGGRKLELLNLRPLNLGMLHAEAEASQNGKALRVALSFGPQYGPVTAFQVQEAIPTAKINGYSVLIFAGFSFDPEAQALIQKAPVAGLQVHLASIAPDVLVGDLLKTSRAGQIFTVFGQPDVALTPVPSPALGQGEQTSIVELRGVDIYDPLTGETQHSRGSDVAAWFLDTDYDGMTFHICQAFFPGDPDAWDKLQRALKAQIDLEAFEQMRGTVSFPFKLGNHNRIAVKVIDFRGNEVVRVVPLDKVRYESGKGVKP